MGWLLWILTYVGGENGSTLDFNPWWITLCFFLGGGGIRIYTKST